MSKRSINIMGNESISTSTSNDSLISSINLSPDVEDLLNTYPCTGHRIISVQKHSPLSNNQVIPFFDFIIAANSQRLSTKVPTFAEILKNYEEKVLELEVFNTKSKTIRKISVIPNRNWPGKGLLGVTIKFDSFEKADENVFHVIQVKENSPAKSAGLISNKDYILGTETDMFGNVDDFQQMILDAERKNSEVELFVYNSKLDEVRKVTIKPSFFWKDENGNTLEKSNSCLGCNIGHGYLHQLPNSTRGSNGKLRVEDLITLENTNCFNITEAEAVEKLNFDKLLLREEKLQIRSPSVTSFHR